MTLPLVGPLLDNKNSYSYTVYICWYWWNCWLSLFKLSFHNWNPMGTPIIQKFVFLRDFLTLRISVPPPTQNISCVMFYYFYITRLFKYNNTTYRSVKYYVTLMWNMMSEITYNVLQFWFYTHCNTDSPLIKKWKSRLLFH